VQWHLGVPLRAPAEGPAAGSSSVSFTEQMAGAVALGEEDPERGHRRARQDGSRLMVHLTIEIDDLERMLDDPLHEALAFGWVQAPQLGGRLAVEEGSFNLFVNVGDARHKEMRYRLFFRDATGRALTFSGVKHVRDDDGFDAWSDTTTLYVHLLEGHVAAGEDAAVVGAGVLRISPSAFARQLTTFDGSGPGPLGGMRAVLRFGWAFAGHLVKVFGRRAAPG
jgi:cholesterol oxidase